MPTTSTPGHHSTSGPDPTGTDPTGVEARMRRADYRRFFAATALSRAGSQIGTLAMPLVAVETLGATAGQMGLLSAAGTAAFLVVGLPAGSWLDRVRKRGVMVAADLARGLLLTSVPVAWALGVLTWTQLWLVVLGTGLGTVFFDIADQSYLPHLVGRDGLTRANSQLATVRSTGSAAGPAVAGWLVQIMGAPLVVAVDAVSYLWSAIWLGLVRRREPRVPPASRPSLVTDMREGLRFVVRQPVLRAVAVAGAMTNVAIAADLAMLPLVLLRDLDLPESVLGAYLAVGGVGGLVGAASSRLLSRWLGEGRSVVLLGVVIAPAAILVPLAGTVVPVWVSALGWGVVLFKAGYDNVLLVSFRQQITPDHLLGRMNATMRVTLTGAVTLGGLMAGLVGGALDARAALWAAGCFTALVWLPIWLSPLRRARTLTTVE
ncbi:MAG: MFS transporter [Nocardioidaceae bacterium]